MARHQKKNTLKQKIIIYGATAATAIIAALGICFLLVAILTKPVEFVANDVQRKTLSDFQNVTTPDFVYVPPASLIVTEAGAKNNVDKILSAASSVKITDGNKVIVMNYKVNTENLTKRNVNISVNPLLQKPELPSGSEITALATVLNYYGYNVSKTELAEKYLDKTGESLGDFNEVFVGNPAQKGFGCYRKPILNAANRYLESKNNAYLTIDYTGKKFEDILKLVESGTPAIIWATTYNDKTQTLNEPYASLQWTTNNKTLTWLSNEHCMVIIGYDLDKNVAMVSDPLRGVVEYDLDTLKARFLALGSQCIAFERKPILTGIENGATYYTTQCVSILDHNFVSVTLNNMEMDDDVFLLHGNKEDTYRITITEQDGNTIEYLVYTKPISSIFDVLNGANELTVTSDNLTDIENIKETLSNTTTDYCSPEETKDLEIYLALCDVMINNINTANEEFEEISEIINTWKDTPPSNEGDISKHLESIMALSSNQNLTAEQKLKLNEMQNTCNEYLSEFRDAK